MLDVRAPCTLLLGGIVLYLLDAIRSETTVRESCVLGVVGDSNIAVER